LLFLRLPAGRHSDASRRKASKFCEVTTGNHGQRSVQNFRFELPIGLKA
jgi:hypothetical protein